MHGWQPRGLDGKRWPVAVLGSHGGQLKGSRFPRLRAELALALSFCQPFFQSLLAVSLVSPYLYLPLSIQDASDPTYTVPKMKAVLSLLALAISAATADTLIEVEARPVSVRSAPSNAMMPANNLLLGSALVGRATCSSGQSMSCLRS
jgi:hypothetical protein